MQIMIDTQALTLIEARLTIELLQSIIGQAEAALEVGMQVTGRDIEPGTVIVAAGLPTPPAAPLDLAAIVGDDDIEVTIDDEGNIASVAAVVTLPAAPPPPAPAAPRPPSIAALVPAATPQPPGPAVVAELDSRGLPWDGRIHASNRAQSIKKEWKLKRGVDKNLVAAVEAQNKPGNASTAATVAPAAAPLPVASSPATTAPPLPAPPAPAVPSAALPSAPPVTAPAPLGVVDFRGLMQKITAATAAGKLSTDQVVAALAGVGLKPEEMTQLIGNAPLIASINAAVDGYLA